MSRVLRGPFPSPSSTSFRNFPLGAGCDFATGLHRCTPNLPLKGEFGEASRGADVTRHVLNLIRCFLTHGPEDSTGMHLSFFES